MIFIINAQGTITAVSPSDVHQGSIGVNDIILVSPALADGVTLNATLPNGIKIDPINMALVYPSDIEGYTEGYYIYRITLNESVTQYPGLLSLRFSIKLKKGGTLTTSSAVIPIVEEVGIIEPPSIPSLDNNADIGNIIDTVNEIIDKLNSINSNVSSAVNAANAADGYREQAKAWATGEIGDNNTPVEAWTPQYNNNAKYYAGESAASATQSAASANRSEYSAIESELWATGSHNNVVYTKVEQTKNNAKYYAQATKSLLESISISYDYETYKLTIEYTLPNSSVVTKEYDFALEPSIVSIDEIEKDGKYYLSLTLANGNKTEIELDDIFEGFVKSAKGSTNTVYGTDSNGNDANIPADKESGNIVRRVAGSGGITVPSPTSKDEATPKGYVEKHFVPIEPYNDFVAGTPIIYSRDHGGAVVPLPYDDTASWDGSENPTFNPDRINGDTYAGCIVQRGVNSEIYVPLTPYGKQEATSKHYVDQLGKRVEQLESATLKYTEYSGVTDAVPVPENAAKFALVNKVGGMTFKGENLWDPSKEGYPEEYGITVNSDNSITFNGYIEDYYLSIPQESGYNGLVTLSLGTSVFDDSTNNYINLSRYDEENDMWDESSVIIQNGCASWHNTFEAYLHLNGTFDDLTIYPMLVRGNTPKPYRPPSEGLRDTKVTELRSEGANCFDISKVVSAPNPSEGVFNEGNSLRVVTRMGGSSGVLANSPRTLQDYCPNLTVGETYTLSANSTGTAKYIYLYTAKQTWMFGEAKTITQDMLNSNVHFYANSDAGATAIISEIMMNRGTTVEPYKPYRGTLDTLFISAEIQSLEGYGGGVEGYPNYIDFERKVFVQNTYRRVLDGTEIWEALGTDTSGVYRNGVYVKPIPMSLGVREIAPMVCNMYPAVTAGNTYNKVQGCSCNNEVLHFYDENYNTSDISLWKAHLAELYASGNPLIVEYAMATPIEHKISAYLTDDEIEVEGGGTIVPVNEYNNLALVEMLFTEKK